MHACFHSCITSLTKPAEVSCCVCVAMHLYWSPFALVWLLYLQVVAPYAKAVVNAAYKSDVDVASDTQLQAFAAVLASPRGSNLVRINAAGAELQTRAQLAQFIEDFVTIVLTHGSAHLQVGQHSYGWVWEVAGTKAPTQVPVLVMSMKHWVRHWV